MKRLVLGVVLLQAFNYIYWSPSIGIFLKKKNLGGLFLFLFFFFFFFVGGGGGVIKLYAFRCFPLGMLGGRLRLLVE
jgi:hypothetical protein